MKLSDLREKSVEELNGLKAKYAREIMDARFKNSMGQLGDTSIFRKLRKDIARVNTILGEKQ